MAGPRCSRCRSRNLRDGSCDGNANGSIYTPYTITVKGREALIVICGPTAVGKTAAAIGVAERLGGEIVRPDSRTIYRGMDIGTAKPTPTQQARVAHHLLDSANPDPVVTLATYREMAIAAMAQIRANGRVPILSGGAGLYIQAVVDRFPSPPGPPDLPLRMATEA